MDERRNLSMDVGLYIYIYIYKRCRHSKLRVWNPLFLYFSLFVRCLINCIQNHITNEPSSIMRKGLDERIVGFLSPSFSLYRLIKFDTEEPNFEAQLAAKGVTLFPKGWKGKKGKKEIGKLSNFRAWSIPNDDQLPMRKNRVLAKIHAKNNSA